MLATTVQVKLHHALPDTVTVQVVEEVVLHVPARIIQLVEQWHVLLVRMCMLVIVDIDQQRIVVIKKINA